MFRSGFNKDVLDINMLYVLPGWERDYFRMRGAFFFLWNCSDDVIWSDGLSVGQVVGESVVLFSLD